MMVKSTLQLQCLACRGSGLMHYGEVATSCPSCCGEGWTQTVVMQDYNVMKTRANSKAAQEYRKMPLAERIADIAKRFKKTLDYLAKH